MKADLTQQWRLLDLQKLDTRLSQIDHKKRSLPQIAEADKQAAAAQKVHEDVVLKRIAVDDADREVAKAEADVQLVRDRAARDRERLDSGAANPKQLTSLQHELETLDRRQSELEDLELEVMERSEKLRAELTALEQEQERGQGALQAAQDDRDNAIAELDKERDSVASQRDSLAPALPSDLVALYDKIREQSGIGAAALVERRCTGCGLELNVGDLGRIKATPNDEVVRCEECRRILVRTAESGI